MVSQSNPAHSTQDFLSGKLSQVDVAKIENELRMLWTEAADGKPRSQTNTVIRACTNNLIVYCDNETKQEATSNIIDEIVPTVPLRLIVALSTDSKQESLEAYVSARCHFAPGTTTKQICSEEINVHYSGEGRNELPSAVLPLVLPDLPINLLWRSKFSKDRLEPFLLQIDRLIFSSVYFTKEEFALLAEIIERYSRIVFCDDSWLNLYPFRSALANTFDRLSPYVELSDLEQISQINIGYNPKQKTAATFFASWLLKQLNYKINETGSTGTNIALENSQAKKLSLTFSEIDCKTRLNKFCALSELSIILNNGRSIHFIPKEEASSIQLLVTVKDNKGQSKVISFSGPEKSEADLLAKSIVEPASDELYEAIIPIAIKLMSLTHSKSN